MFAMPLRWGKSYWACSSPARGSRGSFGRNPLAELFLSLTGQSLNLVRASDVFFYHVGRKASAFLGRGYKTPLSFPPELLYLARNSSLLGRRRYWGDSVSELFGFGLEALDL